MDRYELSPMQLGMLFHALSAPGSGVDIEQIVFTLDERLDVPVFEQAMREVMARYPMLRTRLRWRDVGEPCQEVLASPEMPTTVADWSDVGPEEAQQRFDTAVRADRHRNFDLSCAPMMRMFVARFPGGQTRVLWTFHHAMGDGRSFIVLREWFVFYDAVRRGEAVSLPPARPFRDYIVWRRSLDSAAAEQFWRTTLGTFHASTPFGIEAPNGPAPDEPFGAVEQRLSLTVSEQLREAARRAGVTVNTVVQAAWAVLLHRYSGESDIVFGATRAGRVSGLDDADGIVGPLFNTLPLRVDVDDDAKIVPWLQQLRDQQIALRPYDHTPLATVQACSGITRGNTLFDSVIVYDHMTLDALLQMPGRRVDYTGQTNFPLALRAWGDAGGGEMLLRLEYFAGRFSDAAITRMLGHVANLLTRLAADDATYVGELSLLDADERAALVDDAPMPTFATPDVTLHAGFARQAAATPDAIALSAETASGRTELSYAELDRLAEAIATHLRALGVAAGQAVGLRVERSPDIVIGMLAILKAGGAYLPMDPVYPTERVAFMLQDAAVRVVLTQRELADELAGLPATCVCLDEPLPVTTATAPPAAPGTSGDLAYVMYTSGSTGLPKGVPITHHNVLRLFAATDGWFDVGPTDVWTLFHSYSFDISVWEIWGALLPAAASWWSPTTPAATRPPSTSCCNANTSRCCAKPQPRSAP